EYQYNERNSQSQHRAARLCQDHCKAQQERETGNEHALPARGKLVASPCPTDRNGGRYCTRHDIWGETSGVEYGEIDPWQKSSNDWNWQKFVGKTKPQDANHSHTHRKNKQYPDRLP